MRTLLLTEGESDTWTLWFWGYHALGFPGASTYRKLESWHLEGFDRVIIIQEPDAAGATFAAGLSARLVELGFKGEALIAAMEGSGFKDPSDLHCDDPERFKERFEAVLAGAKPISKTAAALPTINPKGTPLGNVVRQALDALTAANNPMRWFVREATHKPSVIGVNGQPEIVEIDVPALRMILADTARWQAWGKNGPESIHPPVDVTAVVFSQLRYALPTLRGLTNVHMYKGNGQFIAPGYDAETMLWCSASAAADQVEPMEFAAAFDLVEEMLCDFHFASPADKAHAVSLFLLPFMREAVAGPVPIYAIESPKAGTGKGLLAESILEPSGSFYVQPDNSKEEAEKCLTAAVLSGVPACVFDNVHDAVVSSKLASLATNPHPMVRPLGSSKEVVLKRIPILVITANNPTFSEENARRAARIRIDSDVEDPSLLPSSSFKNRQVSWIKANRVRLQAAAHAIIQHWIDLGRPILESDIGWGSFEEWFDVMGGITETCGWPELGKTRMGGISIDEGERRWLDLIEAWEGLQIPTVQVRDLVTLSDQIEGFWGEREIKSKSAVIGRMLMKRRDQVFGTSKVVYEGRPHNVARWTLIKKIVGED